MLLRHHEKTQDLEYRQQKSVHALREDQVRHSLIHTNRRLYIYSLSQQISKQHESELKNQKDYMERAERELLRKHATELKQQPKSLKVRLISFHIVTALKPFISQYLAKGASNTQAIPRDLQNADPAIQGVESTNPTNNTKRWTKSCDKKVEGGTTTKIDAFGWSGMLSKSVKYKILKLTQISPTVRTKYCRYAAEAIAAFRWKSRMWVKQKISRRNFFYKLLVHLTGECSQLRDRLQYELNILTAYQEKNRLQAQSQRDRERKELEERVSVRRALLESKVN